VRTFRASWPRAVGWVGVSALASHRVAQACASWALCTLFAAGAGAQPTRTLLLSADACPSAALVRDMLAPLIPDTRVLIAPEASAEATFAEARLRDLGSDYVIELHGAERRQHDPGADCSERARVAAVFIALNLPGAKRVSSPQAASAAEQSGSATAPAPAATAPPQDHAATTPRTTAQSSDGRPLRVGIGASALVAFAPEPQSAVVGGSVGVWARRGLWQLELSGGATGKSELPIEPAAPGGSAALWRFPLAASAAVLWRVSRFELGPSLGFALDLLRARGDEVARPERALRANAGVQLAALGRLRLTERLALVMTLSGSFFPVNYELRVEPQARSAETPGFWLAAQLGLACIVW
jgi:hypothetical protein